MIQYANKTHIFDWKWLQNSLFEENYYKFGSDFADLQCKKVAYNFWTKFGNSDYSALSAISAKTCSLESLLLFLAYVGDYVLQHMIRVYSRRIVTENPIALLYF